MKSDRDAEGDGTEVLIVCLELEEVDVEWAEQRVSSSLSPLGVIRGLAWGMGRLRELDGNLAAQVRGGKQQSRLCGLWCMTWLKVG